MGVNGVAAARTLLSYRNIRHGYCLYYVWQAYDAHGADTSLSAGTAYECWNKSLGKHPGDRNPPAGVPVFWGPKAGSSAGDVVISLGGGRVACTDYPNYGQVGIATIAERERQIGRPYLGWAERIFDVAIDFDGATGGVSQDTKNRQSWLNESRGEKLTVDGIEGPATTAAYKRYQTFLRSYGYKGAIDGIWGDGTQVAHQKYYDQVRGGKITVDGELGPETIRRLQKAFGVAQDGQWGPATTSAMQKHFGVAIDGSLGPETIKALQRALKVEADGELGPKTITAMQKWLNSGTKLTPVKESDGKLVVDGELGPATIKRMQKAFGVEQDGQWGPNTTRAIQKHFGVTQDGELGPITIKALQRALKVTADGEIGPNTIKALQTWLNSGTKLVPVADTTPPAPPKPAATPRTPTYPKAVRGWNVPLSSDRAKGSAIEWFIIHHQGSTSDDESYFKTDNSRGSCPTWQVKTDGSVVEFIAPDKRPSSSGEANSKSVAVETQNSSGAPNWGITEKSHESIAQLVAWVSQQTEINGVPVRLKLDRTHVFGDNEITAKTGLPMRATACPGPSMNMDWIVNRAKEIVAAATPKPDPQPEPEPIPEPEEPEVVISRADILKQRQAALELVEFFDKLLKVSGS